MKTNKDLICIPVQEHGFAFISEAADLMNAKKVPTEARLIHNKVQWDQPASFCGIVGGNEYHVDSRIMDGIMIGSDDNPGTSDKPLATVNEAMRRLGK